ERLRRSGKTLVVLAATLAAASLLFTFNLNNEAASFLRTPEQGHRKLLQLNHFNDPKSTKARSKNTVLWTTSIKPSSSTLASLVSDVPWRGGIQNAQWCRPPEEDEDHAPPIDFNQCEGHQLIDIHINGGMTSQLNKILRVVLWAARVNSCFFVNEEKGNKRKRFSPNKLGYRTTEDGKDNYIPNFLDRYFDHMGLDKSRFEEMVSSGKFSVLTPTPGEIQAWDFGGEHSLTMDDPSKRFRLRSIPHLGYVDVDNISLKKTFLRRMFRIKPNVREHACHRLASQGLDKEYIALSIRRGDKETEMEILHTVDPYIKEAEAAIKSHFGGEVPTFFVATDDCAVMQEFREYRPEWNFVSECDNATEENGFVFKEMKFWNEEQTDAHFNKFIAEMIGMASAKFWIGVPTTNVSFWVYFMRHLQARDDTYAFVQKPLGHPGLPW
ncbi:hypothetical protein ACHAXR_003755, partial [Thalassiosira sp. AJA248-18]